MFSHADIEIRITANLPDYPPVQGIVRIFIFKDVDLSENPENFLFPFDLLILHQNHKICPRWDFTDFLFCADMHKVSVFVYLDPKQRLKSGMPVAAWRRPGQYRSRFYNRFPPLYT